MKNSLVIILFDHPFEHTADYASQAAKFLCKDNIVIGMLVKDSISIKEMVLSGWRSRVWERISENYYVFTPVYLIPFRRFKRIIRANLLLNIAVVRLLSSILFFRRKITKKYIWIFNPDFYGIFRSFGASYISVYDCVDYHGAEHTHLSEKLLIQTCDFMFVNSHVLYDTFSPVRPDVRLVPMGFDVQNFSVRPLKLSIQVPHNRPVIGYVGGINSRLDFDLLLSLIKRNTQYNYVFIGPIQEHESHSVFVSAVKPRIDTLFNLPHVYHFPYLPKSMIPAAINDCDICTIPYTPGSDFNTYCYPMKLFEYFYMGKPVISTPIDELKRFPAYVKIGKSAIEWEKNIQKILSKPWPVHFQKEQKKLAVENSWDRKFSRMLQFIG